MSMFGYNTRLIFKSKEDELKIFKMLETQRFAWNECSKVKFEKVSRNSIVDLHAAFYRKFRNTYPEIPSQVIISAEQAVLATFRSIKSNKHKTKTAPSKKCLDMRLDKRTYSYKNNIFSLISLGKRIKCSYYIYPKLQELTNNYQFCDPLLFVRDNEIWIALTFKTIEPLPTQTLALGVDLGCRVNAATSEGNLFVDRKFNAEKRRLRHLKDCLKSKAGKGYKSAKRHLKKLRRKEKNKNKNFSHHLANKILDTKADVIVLENLKSLKVKKEKDKYKKQNRLSQVPIYQLKKILTYKALLKQKTVIEVCPSYTSQIDSQSGKKDGIRKGRRYYSKSGIIYDSDINGAVNVGLRSKLPVSQTKNLTYGQAIVNSPIVSVSNSQVIAIHSGNH